MYALAAFDMGRWRSGGSYAAEDEMKLKEERSVGKEELDDEISLHANARIRVLEGELDRARESERKMLESLMSQTRQLERAKIELEETKLELRNLQVLQQQLLHVSGSPRGGGLLRQLDRSHSLVDLARAQQEILCLKNELRMATEAEEKSKMAMDDLAIALREVATESSQAKERLAELQAGFLAARAEADHSMRMLRTSEEALAEALLENSRLKAEAEEMASSWQAKEEGLRACMGLFEDDVRRARAEGDRLRDMQRGSRDEVSKLRDIMKHAVNEATVVKEALEIARAENSQLKDALADMDHELRLLRHEVESIRVSEAAATESVEELKSLLVATSQTCPASTPQVRYLEDATLPQHHRLFASVGSSSMPVRTQPSRAELVFDSDDDVLSFDGDRGSHVDEMQSAWGSPLVVHKKKPIIRKFGDMIRRSFHK